MRYCKYLLLLAATLLLPLAAGAVPHWDLAQPGPAACTPDTGNPYFATKLVAKDGWLYGMYDALNGTDYIVRWNKCNGWKTIGAAYPGVINSMVISGDYLYVAGEFNMDLGGGIIATNIAKYNIVTADWSVIGNNTLTQDKVQCVALDSNGKIYVGRQGTFNYSGVQSDLLLTWNGSSWVTVGGGMVGSSSAHYKDAKVTALTAEGTDLYVGGIFDAGINTDTTRTNCDNLLKWDGSKWLAMASGFPVVSSTEGPKKIIVSGTNVFVGGGFRNSPNGGANGLIRFSTTRQFVQNYVLTSDDAQTFEDGGVDDMAGQSGSVYIAGHFNFIDSVSYNGFARWSNGTWSAIGGGVTYSGGAAGNQNYVIGTDIAADVNPSHPGNAIYLQAAYENNPFDKANGTSITACNAGIRWVLGADNVDCTLEGRISAGASHSLALRFDGTVWAWGYNAYGQLGDGTTGAHTTPVKVSGLGNVVAIAAGGNHNLAIKSDGTLWAWGQNNYGQLGDGTTTDRSTPVQVSSISGVYKIALGFYHSLAFGGSSLYSWGRNADGQLGDGTTTDRNTPVTVSGSSSFVNISAGFYHSAAIDYNGLVWTWGEGASGQLGTASTADSSTPVQIPDYLLDDVVKVSAGGFHTLALDSGGNVFAWGLGTDGQLGGSGTTSIPNQIGYGSFYATKISAGAYHSLALKSNGTVWAFGDNAYGQIGDGSTTDRTTPVQASYLTGVSVISAGGYFSLSTSGINAINAWGANFLNHLGDGTSTSSSTRVTVSDFEF